MRSIKVNVPTTVADCLWLMANEILWDGNPNDDWEQQENTEELCSCGFTLENRLKYLGIKSETAEKLIRLTSKFWRSLETKQSDRDHQFDYGPEGQGERYIHLMFAYQLAKDEHV